MVISNVNVQCAMMTLLHASPVWMRHVEPKRRLSRAVAHDTVVACSIGIASGHLVDLSIIVNRYRLPSELGSGPTTST